eukprot:COSAG05_NODE_3717_length_1886_cov_1.290431_2_plen_240_part_00
MVEETPSPEAVMEIATTSAASEVAPVPVAMGQGGGAAAETPEESGEEIEVEVPVPADKIGAIIGKGGSEIVNMERISGAKIQTPKRDSVRSDDPIRQVKLRGTAAAVAKAKELIVEAIIRPRIDGAGGRTEINVGGHKFQGKDDLWKYCHKLIEDVTEGEPITGSHGFFLYALMSNHPNFAVASNYAPLCCRFSCAGELPTCLPRRENTAANASAITAVGGAQTSATRPTVGSQVFVCR